MAYNLSLDYSYIKNLQDEIMEMEKENPYWEPMMPRPGYGKMSGGKTVVQTGQKRGSNEYSVYSNFYKKVPKSYKTSGNIGYNYYNSNELRQINKLPFPYINYEKNPKDNSNEDIKRDEVEIFDSIKDAVKSDFPKGQLRGGKKMNTKEKLLSDMIIKSVKKSGNKVNKKLFKKNLYDELEGGKVNKRKILAKTVKVGLPVVSGAVASSLGVPTPVAVGLSKIAADVISKKIEGGFKTFEGDESLSDLIVKYGKASKKGGKIDLSKYKRELAIAKDLAKSLSKNFLIYGAKKGAEKLIPLIADEVALRLGIQPRIARTLAEIAIKIIKGEHKDDKYFNRDDSSDDEENYPMEGGKALSPVEKQLHDLIVKSVKKGGSLEGGKFDKSKFEKAFKVSKKLAKDVAGPTAKVAIPLVAEHVGETLGVPKPISKVIGKSVADVVSKQLSSKGKGVGEYSGGMSIRQRRSAKVKEIMKGQEMSLPQASKYIKDNNIDY